MALSFECPAPAIGIAAQPWAGFGRAILAGCLAMLGPLLDERLPETLADSRRPHRAVPAEGGTTAAARIPAATPAAGTPFDRSIMPELDAAYNFARFLARDPDAAQDIVQEAFLRAYRGFDAFRGGDPRAWLFAIVRNCHADWRAAQRRRLRRETELGRSDEPEAAGEEPGADWASDEDTPEEALIRKSESETVRRLLLDLPETFREILVLREFEDLSYRQIAEATDLAIGTVMSRLARARQALAAAWRRSALEPGATS